MTAPEVAPVFGVERIGQDGGIPRMLFGSRLNSRGVNKQIVTIAAG